MLAICFDASELYDLESVDLLMKQIFVVFAEMTKRMSVDEIADAEAKSTDPASRTQILGVHMARDELGGLYFVPAHVYHAKECGYIVEDAST
jgi:hypothetical protein